MKTDKNKTINYVKNSNVAVGISLTDQEMHIPETSLPSKNTLAHLTTYFLLPFTLVAATVVSYYPSLFYDFQFDDIPNIKKFFASRSNSFLSLANSGSRWISYWINAINYQLGKFDPFYYRFFNLVFHTATGVLIFFITYKILQRVRNTDPDYKFYQKHALTIAYITALLFLIHPVQTQTVSYVIQGQLEGLAGLFIMSIMLMFINMATTSNKFLYYSYSVITYALAYISCGTKEIAILSPLLLLVIDWFFIAHGDIKKIIQRSLFYLTFTTIIVAQYIYLLKFSFLKTQLVGQITLNNNVGNIITQLAGQKITRWDYFISEFKVIVHYLWIFICPSKLSVDYDWKMVSDFFSIECIAPLTILLGMLLITCMLLLKNKTHVVAFGILWFFIGIAPRSTFIPSTELVADYKTYFSAFGWLLVLALALTYCYQQIMSHMHGAWIKKYGGYICISATALILGYATYTRNKIWRSPEEFWWNIIQNSPNKARGYNNYAVSIAEKNRHAEAIPFFRKAIKMDPIYPDPWSNIAVCFNALNQVDMAIMQLEQAIKINPTYPEFYNNLSSFYLTKKEYDRVIALATHAIALRPHYGKAYFNRGQGLYEKNMKEQAFLDFKKACTEADFDTAEAFTIYAQCALELQKYQDAIIGYSALCSLNPNNPDYLFNLANSLYCAQQYEQAAARYKELINKNTQEYRAWFNLGETYVQLADTAKAKECFKNAAPLASTSPTIAQRITQFTN